MKNKFNYLLIGFVLFLAACFHKKNFENEGIIYQTEMPVYPNQQYISLLDIVEEMLDFTKTVYNFSYLDKWKEEEISEETKQKVKESMIVLKENMELSTKGLHHETLGLLNKKKTLNNYIHELINNYITTSRTSHLNNLCELSDPDLLIMKTPRSKRLLEFMLQNQESAAKEATLYNYRMKITIFSFINRLLKEAVQLAKKDNFRYISENLLDTLRCCIQLHPILDNKKEELDETGGPYYIIDKILFDADTNASAKTLKALLKVDDILIQEEGSSGIHIIQEIFQATQTAPDEQIRHYMKELDKYTDIAILRNPNKYKNDTTINLKPDFLERSKNQQPLSIFQATIDPRNIDDLLKELEAPIQELPKEASKKKYNPNPKATRLRTKQTKSSHPINNKNDQNAFKKKYKPSNSLTKTEQKTYFPHQEEFLKEEVSSPSLTSSTDTNQYHIILPDIPPLTPSSNNPSVELTISTPYLSLTTTNVVRRPIVLGPSTHEPSITPRSIQRSTSQNNLSTQDKNNTTPIKHNLKSFTPEKEKTNKVKVPSPSLLSTSNKKENPIESNKTIKFSQTKKEIIKVEPSFLKVFVIPQGLREVHNNFTCNHFPINPNPKNQDGINQIFDRYTSHKITFKKFKIIWTSNKGNIPKNNGGSHRTLVYQHKNIGGLYVPHGGSTTYNDRSIKYLQTYLLYIGLRPTQWSLED